MTQLKIINGTYREPTEQQKGMELSLLATGGSTMEEGILKTLEMQRNLESRLQAAPRHTPALAPKHTQRQTPLITSPHGHPGWRGWRRRWRARDDGG